MASKYLQKYPVPQGFQEVLSDFTREVLRDQPTNIIEYAAKYFEMLERGEKFEFDSKFNVKKEDKKYELAYNPKYALPHVEMHRKSPREPATLRPKSEAMNPKLLRKKSRSPSLRRQ